MRWQGRRESDNVEDRRNSSGGPSMGGPGFRLPSGKGGLILLIVVLVAGYYGVDLTGLMTGQPVSQQQSTRSISPNEDEAAKFTSVILATTEDTWGQQFEKMGKTYQQPKLVMYRGMTRTGCGAGQSIMGPFYCPADGTVYIDLSFYDDMKDKLGADGDFAQGYVIAHEVGHHVQNELGTMRSYQQKRQSLSEKASTLKTSHASIILIGCKGNSQPRTGWASAQHPCFVALIKTWFAMGRKFILGMPV